MVAELRPQKIKKESKGILRENALTISSPAGFLQKLYPWNKKRLYFLQKNVASHFPSVSIEGFLFFFFSVFSSFSFQNISGASILNPELCSISKYARTILKRKHLKIQFSFYQEVETQANQCLNLVRTVLSYIAGMKPKKKICTGYFTPYGKMDFSIHISAEAWSICFVFQNLKKLFKIGLFQAFPKWSRMKKSFRTSKQFISWNNIIPNSYNSFQNFGVFWYRNITTKSDFHFWKNKSLSKSERLICSAVTTTFIFGTWFLYFW